MFIAELLQILTEQQHKENENWFIKPHRLWFVPHNFGWKKLNTFP